MDEDAEEGVPSDTDVGVPFLVSGRDSRVGSRAPGLECSKEGRCDPKETWKDGILETCPLWVSDVATRCVVGGVWTVEDK